MFNRNLANFSEGELIEMIRQGDEHAFNVVYNMYWEEIFFYVIKVIKDEDAAKDIVQEIFVSIWAKHSELTIHKSLKAYLFTAARYKSLDFLQEVATRTRYNLQRLLFENFTDNSLIEAQDAKELREKIDVCLDNLPPKMKEVFELSRFELLSHKEIAIKLGISDQTVKKHIHRAIKEFRSTLKNLRS
jgi:RNA polymerase sigma-70 factor (ECF subfamily)